MLQKILSSKLVIISLITLFLLIPLSLISDKISERNNYLTQAKNSVAKSWTGDQQLMGPLIVIPYEVETKLEVWNKATNETTVKIQKRSEQKFFIPDSINVNASVEVDTRYKGIYKIPVYISKINISGVVNTQLMQKEIREINSLSDSVTFGKPYLSTTVSDPRGINSIPVLSWGNEKIAFQPGSKQSENNSGLHAYLPDLESFTGSKTGFNYDVELRGMESLSFALVGQEISVKLSSLWPHPEFIGRFLPLTRTIDASGYQAEWKLTSFASNIIANIRQCESGNCKDLFASGFGVKHIEPVDVYLQSESSVKYGLLFIGLSFVAFFIFEVLKKLPIHAIQYTLVGVAISIFYLLLVSLSEHIAFAMAYLIATLSCVGLLMFYLYYVLRGFKLALIFASFLTRLYGVLYVIISAEDYALLMGSVLAFITLA
ncbi:MAG: cell envelope integrity protein CreD, partial [Gammaproteobacteria bacterium]|nr:cell envelope integrity protein CreD [Gammaproteobacteria bacterium]